MIRHSILELLRAHRTNDQLENTMLQNTIHFIEQHPDCFERSLLTGHVTGSAWIVNKQGTHVLMMHHKKLDKWFQPGGHCDGDPDVMAVAAKEAFEETGIEVRLLTPAVFDVDHHVIPARKDIPEHIHYDIRFLLRAKTKDFLVSDESNALAWFKVKDVIDGAFDESLVRMAKKLLAVDRF